MKLRTESELHEGAKLVRYEYLMLAEAARLWDDRGLREYSKQVKWERRMVTDVFLLHARNLLDFLVPRRKPWPEDILAQHYSSTWARSEQDQVADRTVADWRERIDKLLSHVTYRRTAMMDEDASNPRWPIEDIYKGLVAELCEFLRTLPDSRREWFGSEIRSTCDV